ncbi:hypothetical protein NPX13_g555 [Xylaria arbuscula]|uniref:cellulase n=1 Tax=Xylaria arbuscula TaxID=114810 RepID=A0A9W8NMM6_9PEZI|nr:hypothetical protein NPX13_g555 [Xylaria arbuscula]
MKFVEILTAAATLASAVAAPSSKKRASKFQFVGVNESGAEFGNTALPGQLGKDYTWPDQNAINTMISKGMNTFRVPIMMSVTPTYQAKSYNVFTQEQGTLRPESVDRNSKRYLCPRTRQHRQLHHWKFHDEDNTLVANLNQAAITAIRAAGATSQYIFVEGNSWTGAWHWVTNEWAPQPSQTSSGTADGMGKLTDPSNKIVYEMHQYLDSDGSGTQPRETAGGSNSQCISALQGMLGYMSDNSDVWTGWLWWGAGPWWGTYIYGMEPPSGTAYTGVLPSLTQYI